MRIDSVPDSVRKRYAENPPFLWVLNERKNSIPVSRLIKNDSSKWMGHFLLSARQLEELRVASPRAGKDAHALHEHPQEERLRSKLPCLAMQGIIPVTGEGLSRRD